MKITETHKLAKSVKSDILNTKMPYEPPFKITSKAINLISQISEKIGDIHNLENTAHSVQLRKKNRIKTIHSSLAIENNSLTIEQITAIY